MPRLLIKRLLAPGIIAAVLLAPWTAPGNLQRAHDRFNMLKGCGSCHKGHGRYNTQMLPAVEEALCYRCHGSAGMLAVSKQKGLVRTSVQLRDVSVDFRRPSRHPVQLTGLHRPGEQLPERNPRAPRHVECVDCHRSHRTVPVRSVLSSGRLPRRSSLDGRSPEYQLCYRCHSDSANLPRTSTNIRRRFAINNASYHPVESIGKGRYVPSLRAPWTTQSMISCGDCHGNDTGKGMHGSRFPFLLRQNYASGRRAPESSFAYALCYGCHDRQVLFSGRGFVHHAIHVKQARIPCSDCHNPHGSTTAKHLIEFSSRAALSDERSGRLGHVSSGPGSGTCYVTCHGKQHSAKGYCEAGQGCGTMTSPLKVQPLRNRMRGSPFSF